MNWIEIASAVGVGTIAAKLIDIWLLEPYIARRNLSSWLREKRFTAFNKLTQNLVAFGLEEPNKLKSPFEHYAIAAEALLLVDDRKLCEKIDHFIAKRDAMERLSDNGDEKDAEVEYESLVAESREIIVALRKELREDKT